MGELLFTLLLVIFMAVLKSSKMKKTDVKNKATARNGFSEFMGSAPNATTRNAGIMGAELVRTLANMKEEAPEDAALPKAAPQSKAEPRSEAALTLPGGEDAEGCVGGSMPHPHTEGESREEHGRHMEEMRRREAEEARRETEARERTAVDAAQLRQAVVMAEVLGRPKARRTVHYRSV